MPNFIGNTTEYPVVTPANVDTVPLVQGGVLKQATTLAIGDVAVAVHEAADDPHPQYAQGASIAGLPSVTAAADDVLLIGRVSTTVTYTATTLSTLALDNSYNDSAGQFVAEGFTVGMDVKVTGFTGNVANNIFSAQITALTANKMTIGGTDGDVIVDDAAGESVTIAAWECVRGTAQDIADLTGDADLVTYTPTTLADWDSAADPGDVEQALDQLAERVKDVEGVAASDASGITYTPTTVADWDSSADPGNVDDALDQLAERVTDVETGFQPLDSDLTAIAGLTATTDNFLQAKSSAWASRTVAQVSVDLQATGLVTDAVGFRTLPQNSQSTAYTTVAADSGKHLLHPSGDANARTFTIDSNANVAYPVGTAITFVNETSQVLSIAITSDTLTLAGSTTSGTRSLAQNGVATAIKVTSTKWVISGTGLT
jgi:hypothetical protein